MGTTELLDHMGLSSGRANEVGRSRTRSWGDFSRAGGTPRGAHNPIQEPTMAKVRSWVGLDVHARWVLAVTIDGEPGELGSR